MAPWELMLHYRVHICNTILYKYLQANKIYFYIEIILSSCNYFLVVHQCCTRNTDCRKKWVCIFCLHNYISFHENPDTTGRNSPKPWQCLIGFTDDCRHCCTFLLLLFKNGTETISDEVFVKKKQQKKNQKQNTDASLRACVSSLLVVVY